MIGSDKKGTQTEYCITKPYHPPGGRRQTNSKVFPFCCDGVADMKPRNKTLALTRLPTYISVHRTVGHEMCSDSASSTHKSLGKVIGNRRSNTGLPCVPATEAGTRGSESDLLTYQPIGSVQYTRSWLSALHQSTRKDPTQLNDWPSPKKQAV